MVIIRLARGGSKKRPFYNIVATDSRSRRDGRFIERVGFYNPVATKGEALRIAQDRLTYWQDNGAQLSPTVARLVKQSQQAQPGCGLLLESVACSPRMTHIGWLMMPVVRLNFAAEVRLRFARGFVHVHA